MHEGAGLIADIRESPDDLGLRRIHADWLEENGQEAHAEFVRAQITCAGLPSGSPERSALRQTAQRLLRDNWAEWTRPFREIMGRMPGPVAEQWRKPDHALGAFPLGLLEWIRLDARVLLDRAGDLFALAPLRQFDLYNPAEVGPQLAACRSLRWVESLAVSDRYIGPLNAQAMEALARSPHLERLRDLWLPFGNLGDRGARLLAAAPWLHQLKALSLKDNGLIIESVVVLAAARGFRPEILDLSMNEVGCGGLEALTAAGVLDRVRDLRLIECRIGDDGVTALAGRWSLDGPESLYLRDNAITDAGALALASAPWVGGVKLLDLADNRVGPHGRDALLRACCPSVRLLV